MTSMITEASPVQFSDALPDETDVVIVGGGIAGITTAYFLADHGINVVVCEKGRVAAEQSSRNWGWVRQQRRDYAELPIAMEANRIWRNLAQETGDADLTFTESGCLVVTDSEAKFKGLEDWYDIAKQHQLDTRLLTPADIKAKFPDIKGDWVGGMITPSDGRAEPFVAVPALARAAQRKGVVIAENCAVRTIDSAGGHVAGVVTEQGRIGAAQVVLAGGVWSTYFAANAGVDLPQLAVRSTVLRTEPAPDTYVPNTYTPDLALRRRTDGGYTTTTAGFSEHYLSPGSFRYLTKFTKLLRVSAREVRLLPAAPKGYPGSWGMKRRWTGDQVSPFEHLRVVNPEPSPVVVRRTTERLGQRFPVLAGIGIAESWAGWIDVTPDAVPVLGEVETLPGLFIATGLSGHGFGLGPGVGRVMADLVSGRSPGHDLTRFRTTRFGDGSPIIPGPY